MTRASPHAPLVGIAPRPAAEVGCSRRRCLGWTVAALGMWAAPALAQTPPSQPQPRPREIIVPARLAPLRFGALPLGGHQEARQNWEPLLEEMGGAIGRSLAPMVLSDYPALERSVAQQDLDLAYLSGKLALDAVMRGDMRVIAQAERRPGPSAHRAILLARRKGPCESLQALLSHPERCRMARAESSSVTGFILPQTQLFLPNGIDLETRFLREEIGTHQENALAVANGDADVATNNTTDFLRFQQQFPAEAQRLEVIWQSDSSPVVQFVVREQLPPELIERIQNFLVDYGRPPGAAGLRQREVLRNLHASLGFKRVGNSALLPVAQLSYDMQRQRAMTSQWVSDKAREARLARLRGEFDAQAKRLTLDLPELASK